VQQSARPFRTPAAWPPISTEQNGHASPDKRRVEPAAHSIIGAHAGNPRCADPAFAHAHREWSCQCVTRLAIQLPAFCPAIAMRESERKAKLGALHFIPSSSVVWLIAGEDAMTSRFNARPFGPRRNARRPVPSGLAICRLDCGAGRLHFVCRGRRVSDFSVRCVTATSAFNSGTWLFRAMARLFRCLTFAFGKRVRRR